MFRTIAKREIDIAFRLADILPDVVSNIVGAKYTDKGPLIAYLIFEGLPGMDFHKFRINYPEEPLEPIFACIEAKVKALHETGYVHQDIKPTNIFIVTNPDGTFKDCRLIDLATVQNVGEPYEDAGTNGYLPEEYSKERKIRNKDRNFKLPVSKEQNLHAIRVMKKEIHGGSRKKRRNRKTRQSRHVCRTNLHIPDRCMGPL
jgi:serine/threonine protein kinase